MLFDYVVIISNTAFNDDTSRFLVDKYKGSLYDRYDDKIIQDIITYQESFTDKREQKRFALILDDFIGIKSSSLIWKLCSRYRHYNCCMLLWHHRILNHYHQPPEITPVIIYSVILLI